MLRQVLNQCLNPYLLLILSVVSITLAIVGDGLITEALVVILFTIIMILIAIRSARVHDLTFSGKTLIALLSLILVSIIWDGLYLLSNLPMYFRYTFFVGASLIRLTIFAYGWLLLAKTLANRQRVTDRTIITAIIGYLFIGIIWSFIYLVIWQIDPKAFHVSIIRDYNFRSWNLVMYFSFMTLTTVGYGDIIPVNKLAMALANFEAMIGAFYLTVVLARLVSLYGASE
jgi:hypothetical protein